MLRYVIARLLLAGFSLLLVLVTLEMGFRIQHAWRLRSQGEIWAVYDADLGYRLNPGFDDINADGLRDHPVQPKGQRFRILMLGDSVAYYGEDVDDTFPGRLERTLEQDPALAPIDVLNASVKGYTNYQQMLYLERHGLRFEPDLVGVAFVLNDCFRFLHQFKVEDGRIVGDSYELTPEAVQSVESWLYRTLRKSAFLVWLRHQLAIAEDAIALGTSGGYSFDYRPDFRTAWLDQPWRDVESQLARMRDLGKLHDFRVFLVAFPFGDQYREDYLARDRGYVLKPQQILREICRRLGIPYLDLYPELDPARHLEEDRIHLTAEGRHQVGRRLAAFLSEQGLVPSTP
jgi:lysophospholipase L1-like esterase